MKILVIDDMTRNIAAAHETLKGHEVITIDSIKQAYELLKEFGAKQFDAVLTDLFLPLTDFRGCFSSQYSDVAEKNWKSRDLLPAGLVFALAAANVGVRTVICTDTDHHEDYICSMLDMLKPPYNQRRTGQIDEHKIAYVEARNAQMNAVWDDVNKELKPSDCPDYDNLVKDWRAAMVESQLFTELN